MVILLMGALGVLCVVCVGIAVYFKMREKRMLARLQDMIDRAVSGTFESQHFDESGASLLENSMRRYICDNQQGYRELLEQKENLQRLVSDVSHQAAAPASGIILYAQLLAEELALSAGSGLSKVAEDVHPVSGQFSSEAAGITHPVPSQLLDEGKGASADSVQHLGEAAEDVHPVSDQFSGEALETAHPDSSQLADDGAAGDIRSVLDQLSSDATGVAQSVLNRFADGKAAEQMAEEIHAILEQAFQLDFFIRLLVKLSRMEKDLITVLPVRQPIESVLQALREQYGPRAAEKYIVLTIENSQESAVFDRKWTIEAVGNIIDNAIKYTPQGGRVSVKVRPYTIFLRLDVTDSGLGIKEEEYGKIFTRFYRSEAVHGEKGTGIGLYLAREIMEAQHGYIKVNSEAGKGSTFSLFFLKHELS